MPASKLRILYVEDDPDTREMIALALEHEGFEIVCLDPRQDVLSIARQEQVDAYLLDSWMPEVSGIELCKKIRAFDRHTPVIFYTGAVFEGDREEGLAAGAQAYIAKPASLDEVIDVIRSAISNSQQYMNGET